MLAPHSSVRTMAARLLSLAIGLAFLASLAAPAYAKGTGDRQVSPIPNVTCSTYMQNPHISSGAGGVIAKLNYCTDVPVSSVSVNLYLYLCPTQPDQNEWNWQSQGCMLKGTAYYSWAPSLNQNTIRNVPPTGQPGAHGSGIWIACGVIWEDSDPSYMVMSNPVPITA